MEIIHVLEEIDLGGVGCSGRDLGRGGKPFSAFVFFNNLWVKAKLIKEVI